MKTMTGKTIRVIVALTMVLQPLMSESAYAQFAGGSGAGWGTAVTSSSTTLSSVTADTNVKLIRASQTVTYVQRLSGGNSLITLSAAFPNNNLKVGQKIVVNVTTNTSFNGTFTITWVASDYCSFKYYQPLGTVASTADTGTVGGHYSSLIGWEAAGGNTTAECYNDWASGLSENLTISGNSATSTSYMKITVPLSERNTGSTGTGFKLAGTLTVGDSYAAIEDIEVTGVATVSSGMTLNTNGNILFTGGLTIEGTATLNAGNSNMVFSSGDISLFGMLNAQGSMITFNGSTVALSNSVFTPGQATIAFSGTSSWTPGTVTYKTVEFGSGTTTITGTATVANKVVLATGSSGAVNGGAITLTGDLVCTSGTGGTTAITLNSTAQPQSISGGGAATLPQTININKSGQTTTVSGAIGLQNVNIQAGTVEFAGGYNYTIGAGKTIALSDTPSAILKFTGTSASRKVTLRSSSPGTAWNLTNPASAVVTPVLTDVQDSVASRASVDATNAGNINSSRNTNWLFDAAGIVYWTNGSGDGKWSTAANWSTGAVPISTDSVIFNNTSTTNCAVDQTVTIANLTLSAGYSPGTVTLSPTAGQDLTVTNTIALNANGGKLTDNGRNVNFVNSTIANDTPINNLFSTGNWKQTASGTISGPSGNSMFNSLEIAAGVISNFSAGGCFIKKSLTLRSNSSIVGADILLYGSGLINDCIVMETGSTIPSSSTIEIYAAGADLTQGALSIGGNLRLDYINNHSVAMTGDWNIGGNLEIFGYSPSGSTATLDTNSHNLTVGGYLQVGNSNPSYANGMLGKILFKGGTHTISGNIYVGGGSTSSTCNTHGYIDFGSSTVNVVGNIDFRCASVTPGTSTVNLTGTGTTNIYSIVDYTYKDATLDNPVLNTAPLYKLTSSVAGKTISFEAGKTVTIANNLSLAGTGTGANLLTLNSTTAGTAANLNVSGTATGMNYLSVKDSNASSGKGIIAINSTNVSNNTNWIFGMTGFNYWTNTSGDGLWSTAANWSTGVVPISVDNVVFNTVSSSNCSFDTGVTNTTVGSLTLGAGYIGTLTLAKSITIGGLLVVTQGTFDAATYNVTAAGLLSTGALARTLNLGTGSTWTISGNWGSSGGNITVNPGTSTVTLTGDGTVKACPSVTTFYNLSAAASGKTTTIARDPSKNIWVAGGQSTNTLAYSSDGITWTGLGKSIFSYWGNAVAWNGTCWVAGGYSGGTGTTLAYSSDGINWTGLGASLLNNWCNSITWNGTRFVATGNGANTLAYSSDGINWNAVSNSLTNIFSTQGMCSAWNGTRFVAGGAGTNTLAYSSDGITWTGLGTSIFSSYGCRGVAWNGTRFVAVGDGPDTIAYSSNGITWTPASNSISIFSTRGRGIAWNGTRFVAVGEGTNSIAYSSDGITWTGLGISIINSYGQSVAWNGTRWVAGGNGSGNPGIAYSSDGITWTAVAGSQSIVEIFCGIAFSSAPKLVPPILSDDIKVSNALTLGGGTLTRNGTDVVALTLTSATPTVTLGGSTISNNAIIRYAPVASTGTTTVTIPGGAYSGARVEAYTKLNGSVTQPQGAVTYQLGGSITSLANLNIYADVGLPATTFSLVNGANNYNLTSSSLTLGKDEVTNGSVTFNSGSGTVALASLTNLVPSTNNSGLHTLNLNTSTWNVAGDWDTSGNNIILNPNTSTVNLTDNGTLKTNPSTTSFYNLSCAASGKTTTVARDPSKNMWVAVGNGTNSIAYSSDGIAWVGLGSSIFSTYGYGVCWNGSKFVAVGQGANSLAYSSDGITWTGLGSSIFSAYGRGVCWNGSKFVAVGGGTNSFAYSSDGIIWTGLGNSIFGSSGFGVAWSGIRFVAVGYANNTLAYSSDGITWTGLGTGIFSTQSYGVCWNGSKFVAGGYGTNSLAYSSDGITWTGQGDIALSYKDHGFAWNGSKFVVVGIGNTQIGYSNDNGASWIGSGGGIFSSSGAAAAWNGTRFITVGNGTNSIAYSTDGVTWTGLGTSIFSGGGLGVCSIPAPKLTPPVLSDDIPVLNTLTLGGGTLTRNGTDQVALTLRKDNTGTPLILGGSTISNNAIIRFAPVADPSAAKHVTIPGGDYGTAQIEAYVQTNSGVAQPQGLIDYQLGGSITGASSLNVYADSNLSTTFGLNIYDLYSVTPGYVYIGKDCARGPVTFNSGTGALTLAATPLSSIVADNAGSHTLNMNSSTWNISGDWRPEGLTSDTSSSLSVVPGTSTLNITGTGTTNIYGSKTATPSTPLYNLYTPTGGLANKTIKVNAGSTLQIAGTLKLQGQSSGSLLYFQSTTAGTPANLNVTGSSVNMQYLNVTDSNASGGKPILAYSSTIDTYSLNHNWVSGTLGNVYWTNASGDGKWSTAANWSTGAVPVSTDSVVFNAASVANCSVDAGVTSSIALANLTLDNGYAGTVTLSSTSGVDLTVTNSIAINTNGGKLNDNGRTVNFKNASIANEANRLTSSGNWKMTASGNFASAYNVQFYSLELASGVTATLTDTVCLRRLILGNNSTLTGNYTLSIAGATSNNFITQGTGATINSTIGIWLYADVSQGALITTGQVMIANTVNHTLTMTDNWNIGGNLQISGQNYAGAAATLDTNGHNLTVGSYLQLGYNGSSGNQYLGKILFRTGTHSINGNIYVGGSNTHGYISMGSSPSGAGGAYYGDFTATNAFAWVSGADLSLYVGTDGGNTPYYIEFTDNAGKKAKGYLGSGGTGEALGSEILTNGTALVDSNSDGLADSVATLSNGGGSGTFSIVTGNGFPGNAQRESQTSTSGGYGFQIQPTSVPGRLLKTSFKYRASNSINWEFADGGYYPSNPPANTGNAVDWFLYRTEKSWRFGFYNYGTSGSWFEIGNMSVKQAVEPAGPSSGGLHIVSANGGATRAWTNIDSGFNYNNISSYKIYSSADNSLAPNASATVNLAGDLDLRYCSFAPAGTINFTGAGTSKLYGILDYAYKDTSMDTIVLNKIPLYNLTSTAVGKTIQVEAGKTLQVAGNMTLQGVSGNFINFQSTTAGTAGNLTMLGNATSMQYLNVKDSNASSGKSVITLGSTNAGNNTNWIFGVAGNNYWLNASGDGKWSTAGNWSTGAVPISTDSVIFNTASVSNCSVDQAATVANFTLDTGYTGTVTLSATSGQNLTVSGTITLNSGKLIDNGRTVNFVNFNIANIAGLLTSTGTWVETNSGTCSNPASYSNYMSVLQIADNKTCTFTSDCRVSNQFILGSSSAIIVNGGFYINPSMNNPIVQGTGAAITVNNLLFENSAFTQGAMNITGDISVRTSISPVIMTGNWSTTGNLNLSPTTFGDTNGTTVLDTNGYNLTVGGNIKLGSSNVSYPGKLSGKILFRTGTHTISGKIYTDNASGTSYTHGYISMGSSPSGAGGAYYGDFTATNAFAWVSGADLSAYAGTDSGSTSYYVIFTDSAGKTAKGYIAGSGSGETYGSELISNTTFESGITGWSGQGANISWNTTTPITGSGSLQTSNTAYGGGACLPVNTTVGSFYRATGSVRKDSGSTRNLRFGFGGPSHNYSPQPIIVPSAPAGYSGTFTTYGTVITNYNTLIIVNDESIDTVCDWDDLSCKQLTEPQPSFSGGLHIVSANNGTTRSWASVDSGFDYNNISSYKIYNSTTNTLAPDASATINLAGDLDLRYCSFAPAGIINITGTGTSKLYGILDYTYKDTSIDTPVVNKIPLYNFTSTVAGKTLQVEAGKTLQIAGNMTLQGASGNLLNFQSTTAGTAGNLTVLGGATNMQYLSVKDSNASSGKAVVAYNSTNVSNNTNWIFGVTGNNYWLNTSGDGKWSTAANWSTGSVPASIDSVYFNAASTSNCSVDSGVTQTITIANLTLDTGYTGTVTLSATSGVDLIVNNSVTINTNGGKLVDNGRAVNFKNVSIPNEANRLVSTGNWKMTASGSLANLYGGNPFNSLELAAGVNASLSSGGMHLTRYLNMGSNSTFSNGSICIFCPTVDNFLIYSAGATIPVLWIFLASSRSQGSLPSGGCVIVCGPDGGGNYTLTMTSDWSIGGYLKIYGGGGPGSTVTLDTNSHNLTVPGNLWLGQSNSSYPNYYLGKILFRNGTHTINGKIYCDGQYTHGYINMGSSPYGAGGTYLGDFTTGTAFAWLFGADLSTYAGTDSDSTPYYIILTDSAGKTAKGYIAAGGTGEALGTELITASDDRTFASDTGYWSHSPGVVSIADGVCHFSNSMNNGISHAQFAVMTKNKLYKSLLTISNYSQGGAYAASWADGAGVSHTFRSNGNKSGYYVGGSYFGFIAAVSGATTLDIDDISLKQVTEPAASSSGGLHIVSASNGATRNWANIDSGFDPNNILYYKIYNSATNALAPDASATVNLGGDLDLRYCSLAPAGTINFTGAGANVLYGILDYAYNDASDLTTTLPFYNLTSTVAGKTIQVEAGKTLKVAGNMTLQGASGNLLNFQSTTAGTAGNLTVLGGATNMQYLSVKDSNASSGKGVATLSSTNVSNNTNWIFGVAGNSYWTNASGDGKWSTAANWSTGSVPTSTSNVYFNTASTSNCSVDSGVTQTITIANLTLDTGYTGTVTLSATSGVDLTVTNSVTINTNGGKLVDNGRTVSFTNVSIVYEDYRLTSTGNWKMTASGNVTNAHWRNIFKSLELASGVTATMTSGMQLARRLILGNNSTLSSSSGGSVCLYPDVDNFITQGTGATITSFLWIQIQSNKSQGTLTTAGDVSFSETDNYTLTMTGNWNLGGCLYIQGRALSGSTATLDTNGYNLTVSTYLRVGNSDVSSPNSYLGKILFKNGTHTIGGKIYSGGQYTHGWISMGATSSGATTHNSYPYLGDFSATGAFAYLPGVDLSPYVGTDSGSTPYYIIFTDNAGKTAKGYLAAGGTGEALGSDAVVNGNMELDSNWINQSTPTTNERSSTYNHTSGGTYSRHVVGTSNSQGIQEVIASALTIGKLYNYNLWVYPVTGNYFGGYLSGNNGCSLIMPSAALNSWNNFSVYGTCTNTTLAPLIYTGIAGPSEFYVDDVSVKQVTEPKLAYDGGVHIVSSANGATRAWTSVDSGFNYSRISSYKIYNSGTNALAPNYSATVNLGGDLDLRYCSISPAVGTINFTGTGTTTSSLYAVSSYAYMDMVLDNPNVYYTIPLYNLTANYATAGYGKTLKVEAGKTLSIAGNMTLQGASGSLMNFQSTTAGTAGSLNVLGTATNMQYLNVKDSDASSGKKVVTTGSSDSGNNLNWVFGTAGTVYWTNASGDGLWSTAANWSTGAVPQATDSVVFNTASTSNCSVDAGVTSSITLANLTLDTGYTGTLTLSATSGVDLTVTNSVIINTNGGMFNDNGRTVNFKNVSIAYDASHLTSTGNWKMTADGNISNSYNAAGVYTSFKNLELASGVKANLTYFVNTKGLIMRNNSQANSTGGYTLYFPSVTNNDFISQETGATISVPISIGPISTSLSQKALTTNGNVSVIYFAGTLTMTDNWSILGNLTFYGSSNASPAILDTNGHNLSVGSYLKLGWNRNSSYANDYLGKVLFGTGTHTIGGNIYVDGGSSPSTCYTHGYLDFGSATVNVGGDLDFRCASVTPGTSNVILTGATAANIYSIVDYTYKDATLDNPVLNTAPLYKLTSSVAGKTVSFEAGKTVTIANNLSLAGTGTGSNLLTLNSTTAGTAANLNVASGATVTGMNYLSVKDSDASSGKGVVANNSTNVSNNTNWFFGAAGSNYWINISGDGKWSTAANWSTGSVPTTADNVILNSISTTNCSFDTGVTNTTVASLTLDTGYTGTLTLAKGITVTGALTVTQGTFDVATFNVSAASFTSTGILARTLNLGTGTWTISGNWDSSGGNITVNPGTSTVTLTGDGTVKACPSVTTFYNLSAAASGKTTTIARDPSKNTWVGIGYGTNALAYSSDGINWTGLGTSIFSNGGMAAAWNGTRFVAVGQGQATTSIAYSFDGITWNAVPNSRQILDYGCDVAWNGTRWVAAGATGSSINGSIAYSPDGITWTGLGTNVFPDRAWAVCWNGTRFVAGGNGANTLAYSPDGLTWTGLGSSIFSTLCRKIAWNGSRFVAVGQGTNTLAYSSDGTTWVGLGSSTFSASCSGIVWNGTRFVAVGLGTNSIAYSSDGITWTGLGANIFISGGYGVAWNGTRFIAGGYGTNSIGYSSDGITWTGITAKTIFSTDGYAGASCSAPKLVPPILSDDIMISHALTLGGGTLTRNSTDVVALTLTSATPAVTLGGSTISNNAIIRYAPVASTGTTTITIPGGSYSGAKIEAYSKFNSGLASPQSQGALTYQLGGSITSLANLNIYADVGLPATTFSLVNGGNNYNLTSSSLTLGKDEVTNGTVTFNSGSGTVALPSLTNLVPSTNNSGLH
ncbi:MAG: hypothetical protein NTY76_01930, partial [Candidatus Omnitrophica bacterium]|nr:hypothetical protein [Candidatus Omnitrophota bacterium]